MQAYEKKHLLTEIPQWSPAGIEHHPIEHLFQHLPTLMSVMFITLTQ